MFAARHLKWDEPPVAAVVLQARQDRHRRRAARATFRRGFAKFWLPDDFVFVAQIPRTSTGKFLKSKLRGFYGNCLIK